MIRSMALIISVFFLCNAAQAQNSPVECAWRISQMVKNDVVAATACQGVVPRDVGAVMQCFQSLSRSTDPMHAAIACQGVDSSSMTAVFNCFGRLQESLGDEVSAHLCQGGKHHTYGTRLRCYDFASRQFEALAAAIMCGGR
jgi:hypothetical protein